MLKSSVKFYAGYLPVILALLSLGVAIDRDYFLEQKRLVLVLTVSLLLIPALGLVIARLSGVFARNLRLFGVRFLRARVLAGFGAAVLVLLFVAHIVLPEFGVSDFTINEMWFFGISIVLFSLMALIWRGNFATNEHQDFLFRHGVQPEVYLWTKGKGRHIPDPETLEVSGWTWDQIVPLGTREFRAFPIGPPLESVKRARLVSPDDNPEEVWIILEGERRHVPGSTLPYLMRLNPNRHLERLPRADFAPWPEGSPLPIYVPFPGA